MPLSYSIDRDRCRVIVVATSQPTDHEFTTLMEAVLADPAFQRGFDILWDRRSYGAIPGREYITAIVEWWGHYLPLLGGSRVANVVPHEEPAIYGMARMAELMGKGELFAFSDYDEAVRWLDERFTSR